MTIPFYLVNKLSQVGIDREDQLHQQNYLAVFAWLKDQFKSLNFNTLYDLYAITHNLPLNSLTTLQKSTIRHDFKQSLPCYLPPETNDITKFLDLAQKQGQIAATLNEIPIGACIVYQGNVIATGYNQVETKTNITLHAEIVAIEEASKKLGGVRLNECDLYVTIEPCLMCCGAIIASRVKRVIFGSIEPKTGACVSQYQVFENKEHNHHTQVIGPVDNQKYARELKEFLQNKRS